MLERRAAVGIALGVGQAVARGVAHDVVVRQHPRRRRARPRGQREIVGDDAAELSRVEVGLEKVEVERLTEALGARVQRHARGVHPGFGHRGARRVVRVEHRAPLGVDLVHVVAVEQRVGAVDRHRLELRPRGKGLAEVLGQHVRDVDAEPVDAAVAPEAQGLHEVGAHLGVRPVQIGLRDVEVVEVPLAVVDALPRGSAEHRLPVRRRLRTVGPGPLAEDVAVTRGGAAAGGERLLEPGVVVRGVVRHDVHHHPDAVGVQLRDELVHVGQGPQPRVDVAVVGDVIASVGEGRGVEGTEPDGIHPQFRQVRNARGDTGDVAQSVAVGVGEAARIDLVHHGLAPPVGGVGELAGARCGGGGGCGGGHGVPFEGMVGQPLTAPCVTPAMTHRWVKR